MITLRALLSSIFMHSIFLLIFLGLFKVSAEPSAKYLEIDLSLANLVKYQENYFKDDVSSGNKKIEKINIKKERTIKEEKNLVLKEPIIKDTMKEFKKEENPEKIAENIHGKAENKEVLGEGSMDKEKGLQNVGMVGRGYLGKGSFGVYKSEGEEGGGEGGKEKTDEIREKFLLEKLHLISKIIQTNITYPYIARKMGWEGKVVISFILTREGNIKFLVVEKSSGYEVLDKNAVDTIKKVSKYFPLPPIDVKIHLPISYKLN